MTTRAYIWGLRLFLGVLFLFASEILLWTSDPVRSPLDWGGCLLAYPVLATIVLDLAVRYRIRDVYDSMAVLAIYALLTALLVTPQTSFTDFPVTLITRVMGGHALVGIEAFGLFLALTNAHNRRMKRLLIPGVLWLGFYWGTWLHWMPVFTDLFEPIALPNALLIASVWFVLAMLIWAILRRVSVDITPMQLRLSTPEWLFVALFGMIVLTIQALQNAVSIGVLLAIVLLIGVAWSILWYRRSDKKNTLLEQHIPPKHLSPIWVIAVMLTFGLSAFVAYGLPLVINEQLNQLWLMQTGFALVGTVWYPLMAIVIAFGGVDQQMRIEY
jgi:hypothetical protein